VFLHAPDSSGAKLCALAVCDAADDPERAEADLRPLREFGAPVADQVDRMPYPVLNTLLDPMFGVPGTLNYWKSAFLSDLSGEAIEVVVDAFEHAPTELCALVIEEFHGAVTRVDPTATAFPHREPGYNLTLASQWNDPKHSDTCIA
jgi:hypothetical protein